MKIEFTTKSILDLIIKYDFNTNIDIRVFAGIIKTTSPQKPCIVIQPIVDHHSTETAIQATVGQINAFIITNTDFKSQLGSDTVVVWEEV